jgi:hypothetical protein
VAVDGPIKGGGRTRLLWRLESWGVGK